MPSATKFKLIFSDKELPNGFTSFQTGFSSSLITSVFFLTPKKIVKNTNMNKEKKRRLQYNRWILPAWSQAPPLPIHKPQKRTKKLIKYTEHEPWKVSNTYGSLFPIVSTLGKFTALLTATRSMVAILYVLNWLLDLHSSAIMHVVLGFDNRKNIILHNLS